MRNLLLMRHAKSSWDDPTLADHERPLNQRGILAAERMGAFLDVENLVPEMILASAAKRARQTVEYLLQACPFEGEVKYSNIFYHADIDDLIESLQGIPAEINTVLFVGHNPELEYFLEHLCDVSEALPTAAIAWIEFKIDRWEQIDIDSVGDLKAVWRPRDLKGG